MPSRSSSSSSSSSRHQLPIIGQTSPSDGTLPPPQVPMTTTAIAPNGTSPPGDNTDSNDSLPSVTPELTQQNGGRPWSRVETLLQKEFAREKKAGKLSFERKMELYGEKLEEKFKELEERLLTREEELLLKGRELQRLKAENYLLNCRVETISSPSKQTPRIFQTSPEHPNARIIINPPYGTTSPTSSKSRQPSGDIFDPQLPKKKAIQQPTFNDDTAGTARRSSRKRTQKVYDESTSEVSSDEDEGESKRKKTKIVARRVSEPVPASAVPAIATDGEPQSEGRKRKISIKMMESNETPLKRPREEKSRSSSAAKASREKEARLDRKEHEELYETLQKQVTMDLLKRRGIPTTEQEEMVMNICRKLGLEENTDLYTRAVTSVRYWVAHKSWRLRDHFKFLGQRYKSQHRNEDWSNALPPVSAVKPMTNQKEVERWLFQSLGMRLATKRMMANPDIRNALWIVFVGGLRYGIRAAYDARMTSPVFQTALESLDKFTQDYDYPVNETTGFRGKMKVVKEEDEPEEEDTAESPELDNWRFDWDAVESILTEVQQ